MSSDRPHTQRAPFQTPATRDEIDAYEAGVRDELHCQAHGYPRHLCLACKTTRFADGGNADV